ncbi:MAG: Crp/Fnr family transcriptional regulator [Clostridia bacterium]|nr:Crp/Fnr family transcriptional regulator [Clostridia bacterium]
MNLDFDINEFMENFSKSCNKVQIKKFNKGEVITNYIQKRNQFCMLMDGSADLVRYDYNGNKTIIEHFTKGNAFGEIFYTINTNNEFFVEAKKSSKVLFFKYDDIKTMCSKNCTFHRTLEEKLPEIILNKVIDLNTRIELLTKRTIRDKLLGYFNTLSTRTFSKTISMEMSLTNLADYLSIDRSAMMRELKDLKEEGFIKKVGDKIVLLHK